MSSESNNNFETQAVNDQKNAHRVGSASNNFETFFRHCPNCGKRFEIRLVGKKLIESERINDNLLKSSQISSGYYGSILEVGETEPISIEVEKFQYAYRCKHCGHKWVEVKQEEH
jgi:DNA-directed RNA polymerase subunit RPC12/RpoP